MIDIIILLIKVGIYFSLAVVAWVVSMGIITSIFNEVEGFIRHWKGKAT